jgi:hypothetical protein
MRVLFAVRAFANRRILEDERGSPGQQGGPAIAASTQKVELVFQQVERFAISGEHKPSKSFDLLIMYEAGKTLCDVNHNRM